MQEGDVDMDTRGQIPVSLKVVAWLFIIGGVFAVIEIIISLMHQHININLTVLGLFIGPGLLGLRRGWRTCALVFVWIGLIGVPVVMIFMMISAGPFDFMFFGQKVGEVDKLTTFIFAAAILVLEVWIYHVLTRKDVRRLFGIGRTEYGQGYGYPDRTNTNRPSQF